MWVKDVVSCTRKLVKPNFNFLQIKTPGCMWLVKFYFPVTLYSFIIMVCGKGMKQRYCPPVILIDFVLV